MAKNSDIISYYLKHFPRIKSEFLNAKDSFAKDSQVLSQEYEQEVRGILANYENFENNQAVEYSQLEADYQQAVAFITEEYQDTFVKLDRELLNHEAETNLLIQKENDEFAAIMNQIDSLKHQAYDRYLEMTAAVSAKIDHEMQVHTDFIASEDGQYKDTQKEYQRINAEQANRLLWTIEQSKNALEALAKDLNATSREEVAYLNESVLKTIESLRDTKNRITVLFKTSTDLFSKQKDKIQRLDNEKQKPHSQLNQTIIRQYVKQIRDVNHKKTVFEQMIRSELKESLAILGKRIIAFDEAKNKVEAEKAILQYEIVQKKADHLLHKNQAMADLLISKYQNEIKKIKIDSFKRVEEIKLAYFMPAAFFQNSINLYSNFAFYTRESLEELDGILTRLITFNQRLADTKTDYIGASAKTVEDYKLTVMVHVNDITAKLTDLISKIDSLSKEIITLESKNQLEIAEIRKKMESVDITGDYHKYIAGLENDEYLTCYQHDINMQRLRSERSYSEALLLVEKSVTAINKEKAIVKASIKHLQSLTAAEKQIRDLAFDKQLALFHAANAHEKDTIADCQTQELAEWKYHFSRANHLLARGYDDMRTKHLEEKQSGSETVVEFVHKAQVLIDQNELEFSTLANRLQNKDEIRVYSGFLADNRTKLIQEITRQTAEKTLKSDQAIKLYNRHFFDTLQSITTLFDSHIYHVKWLLVHLDASTAPSQAIILLQNRGFLLKACSSIEKAFVLADNSLVGLHLQKNPGSIGDKQADYFSRYVILADTVMRKLEKAGSSSKKQHALLEGFYVRSLLLLNKMQHDLRLFVHEAEISIIEKDVLLIERIQSRTDRLIAFVNREFDRMVKRAHRTENRRMTQTRQEARRVEKLNRVLKDKVKSVNNAYLRQTRNDEAKLAFVKRELDILIRENERILEAHLKQENTRFEAERKALEKRYAEFIRVYESLKAFSEAAYAKEAAFIDTIAAQRLRNFDESLVALEKKVISLPADSMSLVKQLEDDKLALVAKRRQLLQDQMAAIEGQKFTSRPKYLEDIESVKNRLPQDYLALYKRVQAAETDFLAHFHDTETTMSADFTKFLKDQVKFNDIINRDNVPLIPLESLLAFQESIYTKTDQVFRETIEKTEMTKQQITSEENRMKAKEKRIIG